MSEIKFLFSQLSCLLTDYADNSFMPQMIIINRILMIADLDCDETEKLAIIKTEYKNLFFPQSPLSEFNVWKSDYEERKTINDGFDTIRQRLWELLG